MVLVQTPAPAPGWHHLVYTYDGVTNALYLDGGAPITTTNVPQTCQVTTAILGNYDMGGEFFVGQLDDVRMWADRVLDPADVAALFGGEQ
jgi:hypothetical protein